MGALKSILVDGWGSLQWRQVMLQKYMLDNPSATSIHGSLDFASFGLVHLLACALLLFLGHACLIYIYGHFDYMSVVVFLTPSFGIIYMLHNEYNKLGKVANVAAMPFTSH